MPYPVQNLIEGRGEPVCVRSDDAVQEALRLMTEHDFSQLPVVDEDGKPLGLVTHESISRALNYLGVRVEDLRVSNATVKAYQYRLEDDLFDLLDRLKDTNAVLIVDGEGRLIGIVTSYDSTEYFRRRVEDMMLVEDIEIMVKELIMVAFTDQAGEIGQERLAAAIEKVTSSRHALLERYKQALRCYLGLQSEGQSAVNRQWLEESFSHLAPPEEPKAFEDLTLYEYTELLLDKDQWHLYHPLFNLDAQAMRRLLDKVRETRNALAHFRGEISPTQRDELKYCAERLAQHPADEVQEHLIGIPVAWPISGVETRLEGMAVRETGPGYEVSAQATDAIVPTEEALGPGDSRYAPLAIWLQSQPSSRDRARLTFEDIEKIIGEVLPPSAHQHRAWWANDTSHVHAKQWLDAGWRVAQVSAAEQRVVFARIAGREKAYIDFFSALQAEVRARTGFPLRSVSPGGQGWLTAAGLPQDQAQCLYFAFSFARNGRFRVELYIDTTDQAKNKRIFDLLDADRERFHATMGEQLSWERLSDKGASRIALYHPGSITDDEETLAGLRTWAVDTMARFYKTLAEPAVQALQRAEQVEE